MNQNIIWNTTNNYTYFIPYNCTINELEKKLECDIELFPIIEKDEPVVETEIVTLYGEIESYLSHNHTSSPEQVSLAVKLNNTANSTVNSIPLKVKNVTSTGLTTGDNVKMNVRVPVKNGRRRLLSEILDELVELDVEEVIPSGKPPEKTRDFVVGGKPVNITSITMLVSICNNSAPISIDKMKERYFNRFARDNYATLEKMHSVCSYNKLLFSPENNIIVANITIPCKGSYRGEAYSNDKCGSAEIYGWMNEALEQVKARKIDISKYKRRILILPFRSVCPWAGLASVGCTTTCNTWINSDPKGDEINLPTLFQELAHNIGLMHSNRFKTGTSLEYGDCTDPMGCGGFNSARKLTSMSCINGPQQYKAGWTYPIPEGIMDLRDSFEDGIEYYREIPALALKDVNFARIKIMNLPDYAPSTLSPRFPQEYALYITYRVRQPDPGFDSGLDDDMNGRVYIHSFNSTVRVPPRPDPSEAGYKPTIFSILDTRRGTVRRMDNFPVKKFEYLWFNELNYGLNISVLEKNNQTATISLCRFSQKTENTYDDCTDGLDNDCNGVYDDQEITCRNVLGIPSDPPSPMPPFPSPPRPKKSPPPPPVPARPKKSPPPPVIKMKKSPPPPPAKRG